MANTVNEQSPLRVTVSFKDEDGAPLIPATVDWRLDDMEINAEVVPWTSLPSPAASMNVTIPASNNLIVDQTSVREERMFGVRADDGLGSEAHAQFQYHVLNLTGPTL